MERTQARASVAAVVVALALGITTPAADAAAAHRHGAGHHGWSHGSGRLTHDIKRKDQALLRAARRLDRLPAYAAAGVASNIAEDRHALDGFSSPAEVRHFRPAVYRWVIHALRKAERLQAVADATVDRTVSQSEGRAIAEAEAALLGLDARSDRHAVRGARALLRHAVHAVHGTNGGNGSPRTGRWG